MSLLTVQSLLARLYTDSAFRARFFAEPGEACREMGLTEAERQSLAGLDRAQVERFARLLRQKRLGLVRELLPGTARVLGDRFGELFFEYCERQPSALERVEEAKAFARYLERALLGSNPEPGEPAGDLPECGRQSASVGLSASPRAADGLPHSGNISVTAPEPFLLADLLACERLRIEVLYPTGDEGFPAPPVPTVCPDGSLATQPDACPRLTPSARLGRFQHDMEALYPSMARGESVEAQPDPCFMLIGKVRGTMRVRLKRINAATARLLALCDGTQTLGAIADNVAAGLRLNALERQAFRGECVRFLDPLVESELIALSASEKRAPGG